MARPVLLNRLALDSSNPVSLDLDRALKQSLSSATNALLRAVVAEAEKQNDSIYVVGGFVRDLLLGRPNLDLDLVVEGDAIALGRLLVKRLGGLLLPHKAFGTAVWSLAEDESKILAKLRLAKAKKTQLPAFVDLISARRESYAHSGALPNVQFANIHDDQYRRDFAINTLALRLDGPHAGQLLDPWRGLEDLRHSVLRTLHSQSFADDPTRILRILRLAGRLKFKIEAETLGHLKASVPLLELISGDRIRNELALVFAEDEYVAILQSMQRLGVLRAIQRSLHFDKKMAVLQSETANPIPKEWDLDTVSISDLGFVLWMLHLYSSAVSAIAERLRFSAGLRTAALSAASLRSVSAKLAALSPSKLVARLENEPFLSVYALYLLNKKNKLGKRLQRYAKEWRHVQPGVDGKSLRKLGLKPGPAYSQVLSQLRAAWLDGKIKNKTQEQTLLKKLLNGHSTN